MTISMTLQCTDISPHQNSLHVSKHMYVYPTMTQDPSQTTNENATCIHMKRAGRKHPPTCTFLPNTKGPQTQTMTIC